MRCQGSSETHSTQSDDDHTAKSLQCLPSPGAQCELKRVSRFDNKDPDESNEKSQTPGVNKQAIGEVPNKRASAQGMSKPLFVKLPPVKDTESAAPSSKSDGVIINELLCFISNRMATPHRTYLLNYVLTSTKNGY